MLLKNITLNYFIAVCAIFGLLSLSTEGAIGAEKSRRPIHRTESSKKLKSPSKSKKFVHDEEEDEEDLIDLPKHKIKKKEKETHPKALSDHRSKKALLSSHSKKYEDAPHSKKARKSSESNVSEAGQAFEAAFLKIIDNVEATAKELGFHPNDMSIIFESVKPLLHMVEALKKDPHNSRLRTNIKNSPYYAVIKDFVEEQCSRPEFVKAASLPYVGLGIGTACLHLQYILSKIDRVLETPGTETELKKVAPFRRKTSSTNFPQKKVRLKRREA